MALMVKENIVESESESKSSHKSKSESDQQDDEVTSPLVDKLYTIITYVTKKLAKSKGRVRSLVKEKTDLSSLTNQIQEPQLEKSWRGTQGHNKKVQLGI